MVVRRVDMQLCASNNDPCTNGPGQATLNYVNALFVGANTIYEVRNFIFIKISS